MHLALNRLAGCSVLSTAFEPGAQARYRVVLDPVIYVCAAYVLGRLWPTARGRDLGEQSF